MFKKMFILGCGLFMIAALVYAAGYIINVEVVEDAQVIRVEVSVDNEGTYVGCSFYTPYGREDIKPEFVTGKDVAVFKFPSNARSYEVALWREKHRFGSGPDPDNAWGRENGYYLWNEIDRKKGDI